MAYSDPFNREDIRRQRDIVRLCTLFKGRINKIVAEELIQEKGGLQQAACFLMLGDEDTVRNRLQESEDYVRSLQQDSENFTRVLTCKPPETCQFACGDCDKMWWKRVPSFKPVSTCFRCKQKYDPIPKEHQWGYGAFDCVCGNSFRGFGIMGRTQSKCYSCKTAADMKEVFPPKKRDKIDKPKTHQHNCNGINCYRSCAFSSAVMHSVSEKPPVCIHPRSRDPNERTRIHWASMLHISTGSTIDTFLDQGSLQTRSASLALSLETVPEEEDN